MKPLASDLLLGKLECIGHENWVFAVEWNRDVRSLGNPLGKWWSGKLWKEEVKGQSEG